MPISSKTLFLIFNFFILSYSVTAHTKAFNIEILLNTIPFDDVIENDEITANQLHKLLNKSAHKNDTIWKLDKQTNSSIVFHSTHEKWVLKTYPMSENKQLLLINTQLGNHRQTQSFVFFVYNNTTNRLSEEMERKAYIPDVKENDFLTKDNKLSESEQSNAVLHMNDDGTISASPALWMSQKWKNKTPDYSIKFKWNNNRFTKIKEKI
ncbi:MAG: hypothetical protein QM500_01135 [Methylococcales bacterium]